MPPSENASVTLPSIHPGLSVGEYVFNCTKRNAAVCTNMSQIDAQTSNEVTFSELLASSIRAASGWRRLGFKPGDTIAILCKDEADMYPSVLGALFEGLTLMMVVPSMTEEEVQHHLTRLKPKAVFSQTSNQDEVRKIFGHKINNIVDGTTNSPLVMGAGVELDRYEVPHIENWKEHIALILFSSGSTGIPKAVAFNNYSVAMMVANPKGIWTSDWGDKYLVINTLSAISGFRMNLLGVVVGATRVMAKYTTEKSMLQTLEKYKITSFLVFPPRLLLLVAELERMSSSSAVRRPDLSSLSVIYTGGSALSADSHRHAERVMGVPVVMLYGCTEGCGITRDRVPVRHGSSGRVAHGVQMRLVDINTGEDITTPGVAGEVRSKSLHPMLCYLGNPEATRDSFDEEGFFRTGDMAYFDEDGYLFVVDRIKELLKYKDELISPAEIEGVLQNHPEVQEACVVGRLHAKLGEVPTAFVVPRPGATVTEEILKNLVAERLTDSKKLRGGVYIVKEVPKTINGKFQRGYIKEKLNTELYYQSPRGIHATLTSKSMEGMHGSPDYDGLRAL